MKHLWVRLTLAFVGMILVGITSVAILADLSASQAFRHYVARQDAVVQSGLLDDLAIFYQQHGNWNGVESIFPGSPRGGGRGLMLGRPTLLLADNHDQIVYDERATRVGNTLTADERTNALPVVVTGQTVGYLVVSSSTAESSTLPPAAQTFLDQLRHTLLITALAISGLGILLSLLMSHILTVPLTNLVRAAHAFATRDWKYRVRVGGTDEVAEVGRAFNEMAAELERIEIARRNLVADIAHELRTPLAVMQGNLQAMLDEVYPLEQREIATLYDQTHLLTRLVDDLRELSLADAGQLPLHLQAVDVVPVLSTVAAQFAFIAEAQQVRIEVQASGPLPEVYADPERVMQIMRNLVANALRHTSTEGIIQLGAVFATGNMRLTVCDTGEGIATADQAHVFERFYRVDKARTHTQNSTGLGLAICKAWVEAMGGEIGVESIVGQGSQFWFTLPLAEKMTAPDSDSQN